MFTNKFFFFILNIEFIYMKKIIKIIELNSFIKVEAYILLLFL
jgi:hypothetical protein